MVPHRTAWSPPLTATVSRRGALTGPTPPLTPDDVRDYTRLSVGGRRSRSVVRDLMEFWRSFFRTYLELMEALQGQGEADQTTTGGVNPALVAVADEAPEEPGLPGRSVRMGTGQSTRGQRQDAWPGHRRPRQRRLATRMDPAVASLLRPRGATWADPAGLSVFTKRLVFSSWGGGAEGDQQPCVKLPSRTPYQQSSAGRPAPRAGSPQYDATRPTGLLTFNRSADGRNTGMPVSRDCLYPKLDPLGRRSAIRSYVARVLTRGSCRCSWVGPGGRGTPPGPHALALEGPLKDRRTARSDRGAGARGRYRLLAPPVPRGLDLMDVLNYGFFSNE